MSILKINQTDICPICGANKSTKIKYCSAPCKKIGVATSAKNTFMNKYGVENISQIESIKTQKKQTKLNNYGNENFNNRIKSALTCLEKYGVENPNQVNEIKQQAKNTCIEKYGCENPGQSEEIKKTMKATCIEKYGVDYAWQASHTKEKIKSTNNIRYGVDYPMQDSAIFEKMQISGKKVKEYIFASGKKVNIRGYEPFALDILLTKYKEDDIIVSSKNMPKIWYELDGKKKRYHPDIFIISENKFVEVKSLYTYHADLEKNLLKQQACINSGFNFEFMIFVKGQLQ